MSRVVVTGGIGFLGAAFIARARGEGHDALALDADPTADIVCDIGDAVAVGHAIEAARPTAVVHLAAQLTDAANDDPVGTVRINALGTAAVFDAAERAGVSRVVYASSNAAVGPCSAGSGDATPLAPRGIYGATKAFGEHLAQAMSARSGAPSYLALRFGWVYGPGRRRGWRDVQSLIERVIAGERRIRFPDFAEPIDWTWIDDATDLLMRALTRPLPRFLAVNAVGDTRTVRDAMAHLQRRFPDLAVEAAPAETPPSGWGLVNDRVDALLGTLQRTRLEEGLDRMISAAGVTSRGSRSLESP
jgi:nucleoside-diphosphate-sugar epimerase